MGWTSGVLEIMDTSSADASEMTCRSFGLMKERITAQQLRCDTIHDFHARTPFKIFNSSLFY